MIEEMPYFSAMSLSLSTGDQLVHKSILVVCLCLWRIFIFLFIRSSCLDQEENVLPVE